MSETVFSQVEVQTSRDERSTHRSITERIVVTGMLKLETPASFGNGDADAFTDMPLLEDEVDQAPLLTGASIAGALRNYLHEVEFGYESPRRNPDSFTAQLFGGYSGDDNGWQSPLIVHDALGQAAEFELRDGVKIDPKTRTAAEDKKFDFRLLAAGTTFPLRFELLIGQPMAVNQVMHRKNLVNALATALDGLARGEITLGARKRRGFGRCSVNAWTARRYNLRNRADLLAWLAEERRHNGQDWIVPVTAVTEASIVKALGEGVELLDDYRQRFCLKATFAVDGAVIVRSGFGEADVGADLVHLHSFRDNAEGKVVRQPVIAGTSWAGVLRSRTTQIANTLTTDRRNTRELIEAAFGPEEIEGRGRQRRRKPARASRIEIAESMINGGRSLRQSHVKLDRFTGGAFESALFDEEPVFGNDSTQVELVLSLRAPTVTKPEDKAIAQRQRQAEIGMLLLALKDLWTGDLALGGESGIGRGRFKGLEATLSWDGQEWNLKRTAEDGLSVTGDKQMLQACVNALKEELTRDRTAS